MRLRHTIGISLALLVMSSGAMANPTSPSDHPHAAKKPHLAAHGKATATSARKRKLAAEKRAKLAAERREKLAAEKREKLAAEKHEKLAEHRRHPPPRTVRVAARRRARSHRHVAERTRREARPEDRIVGTVRPAGTREIGTAAWYGGWHLGRRTASGERLDSIHDTAAHRTLPLMSLARVTNLSNGRSVIVRVNDRGPASPHFAIDLSPAAAEELHMIHCGVARVAIEPVVMVSKPK